MADQVITFQNCGHGTDEMLCPPAVFRCLNTLTGSAAIAALQDMLESLQQLAASAPVQELRQLLEAERERRLCVPGSLCIICEARERDVILAPCHHRGLFIRCEPCTRQLLSRDPTGAKCPTCRGAIVSYVNVSRAFDM